MNLCFNKKIMKDTTDQQKEAVKLLISNMHQEYKRIEENTKNNPDIIRGYDAAIWDMCVYAYDLFDMPTKETYFIC